MNKNLKWHQDQISAYKRKFKEWLTTADGICTRYRLEKESLQQEQDGVLFNILFANVQTMRPALFSHAPLPYVERAFADDDPIGRLAATVMERALKNELEQSHCLTPLGKHIALDLLLCGRGVAWIRYDAKMKTTPTPVTNGPMGARFQDGQPVPQDMEIYQNEGEPQTLVDIESLERETTPLEYVHFRDFYHAPGVKNWEELRDNGGWVARRVVLTREQVVEQFGEKYQDIPLTATESVDQEAADGTRKASTDDQKENLAEVIEFWDAENQTISWFSMHYDQFLKQQRDELGLQQFFPCQIFYRNTTNESMIPLPDYVEYRGLAGKLNTALCRYYDLIGKMKLKGLFDEEFKGLAGLLDSAVDADMLGVKPPESGMVKDVVQFLPLQEFANTAQTLANTVQTTKDDIYEISGVGDILRGRVDPHEKLGQSRIKSRQAGQRLEESKQDLNDGLRNLIEMMGEIQAEHYEPETLRDLSGFDHIPEVQQYQRSLVEQFPDESPDAIGQAIEDLWQQVIGLIQNEKIRGFRIDIETDSTSLADDMNQQDGIMSMLDGISQAMERLLPMAAQMPELASVIKDIVLTVARRFHKMVQAFQQPPAPSPEEEAAMVEEQAQPSPEEMQIQLQQMKAQMDNWERQQKAQQDIQRAQALADINIRQELVKAQIKNRGGM